MKNLYALSPPCSCVSNCFVFFVGLERDMTSYSRIIFLQKKRWLLKFICYNYSNLKYPYLNFSPPKNYFLDMKALKKQLKKSNDPKVNDQLKERISWIVSTFMSDETLTLSLAICLATSCICLNLLLSSSNHILTGQAAEV